MRTAVSMTSLQEVPLLPTWLVQGVYGPLSTQVEPARLSDEDDDEFGGDDDDINTGVITKTEIKTKRPHLYKVLMLNDDYTPMEFVVHVLQRFFRMTVEEATQVMLHVHQKGVGVCGVFPYDVAETKVNQVMDLAKQHQHPLQCTLEKE
ncbi:MAG: ATP-dependent Clp protease adapter ClpS [Pseudomonadota bacterium]